MEKKYLSLEDIVSFAKRRGFVYRGSELYGGFVGTYDYGPYGAELLQNIKNIWWKKMVYEEENIVGINSAIVMHPKVWEASGHTKGFSDPLVECKACHTRSRADHLIENAGAFADEKMSAEEINAVFDSVRKKVACPHCGAKDFTSVSHFNLLVKSNLGNFNTDWKDNPTYLRGETCQGIYANFKNVVQTTRVKVPFGIAQIGKAFRNEIAPRQYIFRLREFEQAEMQMFVHPKEMMNVYEKWKEKRMLFYTSLGFRKENLAWHRHENLIFYAKDAWDIEYRFPFGFKELEGIHARGDYDLSVHSKGSGEDLSYTDPLTKEKYIPHIVETSVGVDRIFFAVLTEFYQKDMLNGEERSVFRLPFVLAPVKCAVFPLLKNKPELIKKAREVFSSLSSSFYTEFDDNGNIGKRYRRQDEIGTPYCITIDFDTLEDDTVTIRERDTGEQKRIPIKDIKSFIEASF